MANFCSGVKVRLFGGAAGSMSSSVTSSFWARSIKGVELVKVMVSVLPVSPWREERLRQVSHVSLTDRVDTVDFNATTAGQPIVDNDRLAALVKSLGQHRLGLRDVQPDLLGNAYEYLIRKFAEGQGQSAGEFYTPAEVARLMARILDPQPGMTVYDPACGSAGLLIKCHLRLLETHGVATNEHRELPR